MKVGKTSVVGSYLGKKIKLKKSKKDKKRLCTRITQMARIAADLMISGRKKNLPAAFILVLG
jgi:hypothetical protein